MHALGTRMAFRVIRLDQNRVMRCVRYSSDTVVFDLQKNEAHCLLRAEVRHLDRDC